MKQQVNKIYGQLWNQNSRYFIFMGGRGAGRSTVASQYANSRLAAPEYFRCAIMRYVLGDIRNSIYREIIDRATENDELDKLDVNESGMTIRYGANSINAVGFKKSSSDQKAKLKSLANYNCVIIEEADEIPEEDFIQLDDSLRTLKGDIKIILLLNCPPKSHWIIKKWFNLVPVEGVKDFYMPVLKDGVKDTVFIQSSYKDNIKNIDSNTVDRYEGYKVSKPAHYYNMIAGLVPETVKGKIYKNWKFISELPHEARLIRRGLDFGYSTDPTSLVDIYRYNGGYIFYLRLYKKEMSNQDIADFIKTLNEPLTLVVADSAEPKSIAELSRLGINILPVEKGPGSVNQGIQFVQAQAIFAVEALFEYQDEIIDPLKVEYENYSWTVDKEDTTLNVPKPGYDHAMDAVRYALSAFQPEEETKDEQFGLYTTSFT